jgi:hypothetical protein
VRIRDVLEIEAEGVLLGITCSSRFVEIALEVGMVISDQDRLLVF